MSRFAYIVLLAVCLFCQVASGQVKQLTTDSLTVCRLLHEASTAPQTTCLTLFFARHFLGRPYVAYTLEGNEPERLVVNTRQLDCTTLVENVVALTLCAQRGTESYSDFKRTLTYLRYRGGKIDGYISRIHYFTEWIIANTQAGIVKEVQLPNPPFTGLQKICIGYMSQHPESYVALRRHPEYVSQIREMEQQLNGQQFRYIPKSAISNSRLLRQTIKDGDIIAITCNKSGLDIAHLGFAVWRKDGLHMLNASQLHKKVVEEPMTLSQYLQKHPSHTGIRIIRIQK